MVKVGAILTCVFDKPRDHLSHASRGSSMVYFSQTEKGTNKGQSVMRNEGNAHQTMHVCGQGTRATLGTCAKIIVQESAEVHMASLEEPSATVGKGDQSCVAIAHQRINAFLPLLWEQAECFFPPNGLLSLSE